MVVGDQIYAVTRLLDRAFRASGSDDVGHLLLSRVDLSLTLLKEDKNANKAVVIVQMSKGRAHALRSLSAKHWPAIRSPPLLLQQSAKQFVVGVSGHVALKGEEVENPLKGTDVGVLGQAKTARTFVAMRVLARPRLEIRMFACVDDIARTGFCRGDH